MTKLRLSVLRNARLAVLFFVITLFIAASSSSWQLNHASAAAVGDANCDGQITSVDAVWILQFAAGLLTSLPCQEEADTNLDGAVTSLDAVLVLQFVAGRLPNLPPGTLSPLRDHGLAYGPFRDGQGPSWIYPTRDEIREDLSQLQFITSKIRTYGSSGSMMAIAEEAADLGFAVTAGASLAQDSGANDDEIAAVIELANRGLVDAVVVGNETQLAGTVSQASLLGYIDTVRASIPSTVRVTTAEPWDVWLERPKLVEAVDYVMIHVHPFWGSVPIGDAASHIVARYLEVTEIAPKDVVIGETGWPTGGTSSIVPGAVASADNQRQLLTEFVPLAKANGIEFFWFSTYDEEWKWNEGLVDPVLPSDRILSGNYIGSSWGLLTSEGQVKDHLANLFLLVPRHASRAERTIFDDRGLATFYDMGVDSSQLRRDWLERTDEGMRMAYPSGQAWGAVFITVGEPVRPPRPWKDFSSFSSVTIELRGEVGGESVAVGIKDATDPDTGRESRVFVQGISTSWQTLEFQLDDFISADLDRLYVVMEFVFADAAAQTVHFRNITYLP
jgi:exo-beta-1,3-glucanase (GH17 family)